MFIYLLFEDIAFIGNGNGNVIDRALFPCIPCDPGGYYRDIIVTS